MKPFDLEAFKAGQKALTRNGRVATFVGICEHCDDDYALIVYVETATATSSYHISGSLYTFEESVLDLVSMVSRHQHLINSYDPEDTWQEGFTSYGNLSRNTFLIWRDISKPNWEDQYEYRLHPHNDLIKAWKKGAKIECKHKGEEWCDASSDDIRSWYEDVEYRIKPEPVIHCLAYDVKCFNIEQHPSVVEKSFAVTNGWKIIQEWEV